jgi:hypothetical protein
MSSTGNRADSKRKGHIIIPIHESSDARVFSEESSIIQVEALNDLQDRVKETLGRIKDFSNSLESDDLWERLRHHDVITILGGRGTGKTTFILNALHSLSRAEKGLDLINLGIIDPTLVECRESIFLNIISRIRQKVDNWRNSPSLGAPSELGKYDQFQRQLQVLAKGLSQLNGIGSKALMHDAWDEPEFIMEEGLNNVQQGEALERDFHLFIKAALDCLGKKAFIMAFDDIDTNFSNGWDVLEILRKYLTSPQLVVLLSGDFDLYSNLVRMKQWEHFDKEFLKKEFDTGSKADAVRFRNRVDSLEDQYMLKILKPSRRIELKRLEQVVAEYTVSVLRKDGDVTPEGLSESLREMLITNYHLTKSTGLPAATLHLIKQPVRTVIQILRGIEELNCESSTQDQLSSAFAMHDRMARIFATPLRHLGFQGPKDILATRERFGMNTLALRLQQNGLLEDGAALPPTLGSDDRNSMALVMGGHYATAIHQQPGLLFDYFIKVLLTRDEVGERDEETQQEYLKLVSLEVDDLCSITALKHGVYSQRITYKSGERPINRGYLRLSAKWIQRQSALERIQTLWCTPELTKGQLDEEVIPDGVNEHVTDFLNSPGWKDISVKHNQLIGKYYNISDSLSKYITSWHKAIANLLLVGINDGGRKTAYFLSAYRLVALIGLLAEFDKGELEDALKRTLWPKAIRKEQGAVDDKDPDVLQGEDDDTPDDQNTNFDSLEDFLEAVDAWKSSSKGQESGIKPLPLQVYADIWSRFQDTIDKIAEELKDLHAGFVIERFVVAFLNACLVEECLHNKQDIQLNLDRPISAEDNFVQNLAKIRSDLVPKEIYPLFSWVFACPVWSILLGPDSQSMKIHQEFLSQIYKQPTSEGSTTPAFAEVHYSGAYFRNLYPLLNTLAVSYAHKQTKKARKATDSSFHGITYDDIEMFISKLTPLSDIDENIINGYYDLAKTLLEDKWGTVSSILKEYPFKAKISVEVLANCARVDVFRAVMAKSDQIQTMSVKPSTPNGQAYLRAFMEVFKSHMVSDW